MSPLSNTEVSNPIRSNPYEDEPQAADGMGTDTRSAREIYREIILENIEYRHLVQNNQIDRERLDELVELIVDTVCSARKTNLTLQEAVTAYQVIPAERLHGIKGIGFTLEDGSMYSGMEYPLVQGNRLDLDTLCLIEHFRDIPGLQI